MRTGKLLLVSLLGIAAALAQGNRGSITGTISDPGGAVIAGVSVEGKNIESGALYTTATTSTGNYTLSELPPGPYEVTVTAPGFKTLIRGPLDVGARQTLRIDGALEVGTATESITVTDAATLLITETAEVGYNVSTTRLNDLPVGNMGTVRNIVRQMASLMPGVAFSEGFFGGVKINGNPTDQYNLRIDGMDSSYGLGNLLITQVQPSVEAIEEYAVATSNFAAELGQAAGSVFSVTMKSGGNQYHGSVFDYWATDRFYAAHPYTKVKNPVSTYDWGFTVGGPVSLPGVYDGRNKTFFFASYEGRPATGQNLNQFNTVPSDAYRNGDFSAAMSLVNNRVLLAANAPNNLTGAPIIQNMIFDPASNFLVNGQVVRTAFIGNQIPLARFDDVSKRVLALIPRANVTSSDGVTRNHNEPFATATKQYLPSFKIDQNLNSANKLSFFYSWTGQRTPITTGEGFPTLITSASLSNWTNRNFRLNYDVTLSPTLLLHLGAGYQDSFIDQAPLTTNYDPSPTSALGLTGPFTSNTKGSTFPQFGGLSNLQGGLVGPANAGLGSASFNGLTHTMQQKTTGITTLTWVKSNHTYKFGGEMRVEGYPSNNLVNLNGFYNFNAQETALPYLNSITVGGNTIGFPFASFLLGQVNNANVSMPADVKLGKHNLGFFAQDTWKITNKLTLDYGLRWDYSTYNKEQYGRMPTLDPLAPNLKAGGRLGATQYEATCNCRYAGNYPWGFGPRLGFAYQITPKTVLRGGIGLLYNTSANPGILARGLGSVNPIQAPAFTAGLPAMVLGNGVPLSRAQIAWPNFDPSYYPIGNTLPGNGNGSVVDQNASRPARQLQWSIGVQREIFRNLVIEASYVANRGVWWTAGGAVAYNTFRPEILQSLGINLNNAADVALLNTRIDSPLIAVRNLGALPFSNFPGNATLAQALRPFPQFTGGLAAQFAPLGKTWYDSLQSKITKRLSHGIDFTYAFTFQKALTFGGDPNNVFNRPVNKQLQPEDQRFQNTIAFTYNVPRMNGINSILAYVLSDWQISGILQYQSGFPMRVPAAQNNLNAALFQTTNANRKPGVPLFLGRDDLNSPIDPRQDFVLNRDAWEDPLPGQWGTSAPYYSDYRQQRRPDEAMNFGRNFRIGERVNVQARVEFTNVFNRAQAANPTSNSALAPQVRNTTTGETQSGFGFINFTATGQNPRQGQLVLRVAF